MQIFADDKYEDTDEDYCISGTGKITKDQSIVRAKASFRATMSADTGWYWVHSRVLPYSDEYSDVKTDDIMGYVHQTTYVRRGGQPKSNGRAYVSAWAQSGEGYPSSLIDLPKKQAFQLH